MNIPKIAIKNHVFTWMLMAALLIFGGIAFDRMGVSSLPDVNFPTLSINVALDGAAPEVMELTVVDVIEGALTSIPGVESLSSNSKNGSANITVEFSLDKNIDVAVQEVESALSKVQRRLPADMDPPSVSKSNSDDDPILWVSITAEGMSRKDMMSLVQNQVQERFSTIAGVGEITLGGFVEPNLRVYLSNEKLKQNELTATDIIDAIEREHSERPGGRIETATKELNIRTLGEAPSVEDFGLINISRRGGALNYSPVALKDVAKIEDSTSDIRSMARVQGVSAIGIGIRKQPGSNAVQVADAIKERVQLVKKELPKGVEINVRFDSSKFIKESVHELYFTLIFSAILTAVVCFLFLGSFSATVNIVMAIPTSVVGTFIVLNYLNYTLNTFTLLGLSLAIGIVVDDAIMVLENIVRHKENGKSRLQAALDGASEIAFAALAATIAIIAIFLPVAFMDGVIGKYFVQFGVTLSVAVAISLLEALTLTPMRSSRFLTVEPRTSFIGKNIEDGFLKLSNLYRRIIANVLDYPVLTLCISIFIFAASLLISKLLKQEFIPSQDQSRLGVRIQTPVGSSLAYTNEKMMEIEKYLLQKPEVESFFSFVGAGQVNAGNISITLKPPKERKVSAQAFSNVLRNDLKEIKGFRATVSDPSLSILGGRRSSPVSFSIKGPNWEQLIEYSKQIMLAMEESGQMTDVDSNYQEGMPELQITPDRESARRYGVDVSEITKTISTMMSGTVAAKFSKDGRRYDVRVGLPAESRNTIDVIKTLQVRNNRNELISLDKVIQLKEKSSLQSITREDRQRSVTIRSNVAPSSSQAEAIKTVQKLSKQILPQGYYATISGSAKTFQDSFSSLIFALVLGILVSYMVLASQFNSFIHPITILIALPFSISGAFMALYLGGQTLNIYSMIGIILLMGIAKKNSILLVEFTNHMKEKGMSAREALLEACPSRLRPIIMTSIATITGALPAALSLGPGAESLIPMALAVIGGVFVSTLLTLFVVPSVYFLFEKIKAR